MTKVPIADIATDRQLPVDAGLDDLVKEIKETGKIAPIQVSEDLDIIDGLRRIRAAESLGWQEVDAIVSSDIVHVLKLLKSIHKGVNLKPRRLYEFHTVLIQLNDLRLMRLKGTGAWRIDRRPKNEPVFHYSEEAWRALGMPYRSSYQRAVKLYALYLRGDPLATELMAKYDSGELTMEAVAHRYEGKGRIRGYIKDGEAQRGLTESSLRSIGTTISGLNKLGTPLQFTTEELEGYMMKMMDLRRSLTLLHRAFRKELEKKGT